MAMIAIKLAEPRISGLYLRAAAMRTIMPRCSAIIVFFRRSGKREPRLVLARHDGATGAITGRSFACCRFNTNRRQEPDGAIGP